MGSSNSRSRQPSGSITMSGASVFISVSSWMGRGEGKLVSLGGNLNRIFTFYHHILRVEFHVGYFRVIIGSRFPFVGVSFARIVRHSLGLRVLGSVPELG